jgi:hypothetical protein
MDRRPGAESEKMIRPSWLLALALLSFTTIVWAEDRLELDATSIQGSRELPKVLYIVPWKSARLGSLSGGAGSGSFDTALEALDRDVFRRQVEYYGLLHGQQALSTK